MLAALLVPVAQNDLYIRQGRFPASVIEWARKRPPPQDDKNFVNLIKWIKKEKKFEDVATDDVLKTIKKIKEIPIDELLYLDDEEVIILLLIMANLD